MSIYEEWKKAENKNMFFIAPEGYGKSTQLKDCCRNIINNHKFCIPVYIDLADSNITNKKEDNLFEYVLNNCFGELSEDCKVNHLKRMLKNKKNYKYVFLIDHFEISIDKKIFPRTVNEICQLTKYETCNVIIASTFYDDDKKFKQFKCLEFKPLNRDEIIKYIDNKIKVSFDKNRISDVLFDVLSVPYNLKEFVKLVNETESSTSVFDITSEYELVKESKFKNLPENKTDVFKKLMEIACFCSKNNTKYLNYKMIKDTLSLEEEKITVLDKLRRFVNRKHITEENETETFVERFGRINEQYGIGIFKEISKDEFIFLFNYHLYIDYFTAQYLYRLIIEGDWNWSCLNEFVINQQTAKFLSLDLKSHKEKVIKELNRIVEYNKKYYIISDHLSFRESKYIFETTNLLNIYYNFNNSFDGINLSYLDLRLCDFIGKNCANVWFNNSLLLDECFVPVEPESANIFAISKNGRYFITGDKDVINIRTDDYQRVFYRLFSDDGNEFVSARALDENTFSIVCKNNILLVKIDGEFVTSFVKDLNGEENIPSQKAKSVSESILAYGEVCCVENNYAIVKSDKKSYYGNAYLLFNLETEVLVSYSKINSPIAIENIVQTGDEIEFLYPNDGKPLKSICYNEKTKGIYYKQDQSMVGRGIGYKDGTKIYFDSDSIDSYIKYYFRHAIKRTLDGWFNKKDNFNFKISENDKKINWHFNKIKSKKYNFDLSVKGNFYLFHGQWLTHPDEDFVYDFEMSTDDFYCINDRGLNKQFKNYNDIEFNIIIENELKNNIFSAVTINIVKYENNKYQLLMGNSVYNMSYSGENKKYLTEFVFKYDLNFTAEYLYAIHNFSWKKVIEKIAEKWFEIKHLSKESELESLCREVVSENLKQILSGIEFYDKDDYEFVFSCYMFDYIYYNLENNNRVAENSCFINGIKNWCFPCDNGIIYYNGKYSVYLRKGVNGDLIETPFCLGVWLKCFRNGVHFDPSKDFYNSSCFYKLYDIFKDYEYNADYAPRIPIYDLNMYGAVLNNVKGLSAVVVDTLEKQTEIDTKYQSFENE